MEEAEKELREELYHNHNQNINIKKRSKLFLYPEDFQENNFETNLKNYEINDKNQIKIYYMNYLKI